MFFNCCLNACLFYRGALSLKLYCLAAIMGFLWQQLFWRSCNSLLYLVTEHEKTGMKNPIQLVILAWIVRWHKFSSTSWSIIAVALLVCHKPSCSPRFLQCQYIFHLWCHQSLVVFVLYDGLTWRKRKDSSVVLVREGLDCRKA